MKKRIKAYINKIRFQYNKRKRKNFYINFDSLQEINEYYNSIDEVYDYFHHYFWNLAPIWLKEHRAYFKNGNKGFGEDAFHAMWYLIFNFYKPISVLEIGVYRGQSLSLFSLLAKKMNYSIDLHGISPFDSSGDEVSIYLRELNYYEDVLTNFSKFSLPNPNLHKGFSTNSEMVGVIKSKKWDLIYIDGNHDYDVAKFDFDNCSKMLKVGGLLVLDDSSLNLTYNPNFYASKGHPGPSTVADEISKNDFVEILTVGHNRVFQKK
jgi:hypothetical protein